ncbi:MAG TPA: Do family serine endopeptidase [Deltaproteobacteria bacterium]|nr:Do family serine endopeptidase [Deltaproteobacteria bacterium]
MKRYTLFLMLILAFTITVAACSKESATPTGSSVPGAIQAEAPKHAEGNTYQDGQAYFRGIITKVATDNIPAVVHIEVTQRQEVENPYLPFEGDPFFRRFFDMPQGPRKFKRELKGLGTGMIIKDNGFILTNNHVVAGATQIQVILSNGNQYEAKVVGTDPKTDLAVIKITEKEKLPFVTFGDSDKVQVGEWVVAIGHPRGLDQTVTQGIISAKHRQGITDPNTYQDFLQTDTAINPGNSGGPLLNLDGQVIGVNSVIASESGGFEGIGFAIPSNMAVYISNALMEKGKVQRGWLGLTLQDLTFDRMKSLKLSSTKGAYVMDVAKGGPSDKAGIRTGDVILSYDGKDIADSGELRNMVAGTAIGSEVKVGVLRDGKKLAFTVRIGDLSEAAKIMATSARGKLGAEVRPLTDAERERYGLEQDQGVAVRWLDAKGPLAASGIEIDDVILQIDDQTIDGVETFTTAANVLKAGQTITILVVDHRSGQSGTIQVRVK